VASPRAKLALLALIPVGAVALLWLVAATRNPLPEPGEAVEISGPMPALDAAILTEERLIPPVPGGVITPDLFRGKVTVVNFWASWCGPCRREQPGLERLWKEYRERGVQFIGVNFKDDAAAARAYAEEFSVTYPSIQDRTGEVAHQFGVPYLPATIMVGRDGDMRYLLLGAQAETSLRRYLGELLASG
jgi:thiol-disulfide isomerase/thioredoxin